MPVREEQRHPQRGQERGAIPITEGEAQQEEKKPREEDANNERTPRRFEFDLSHVCRHQRQHRVRAEEDGIPREGEPFAQNFLYLFKKIHSFTKMAFSDPEGVSKINEAMSSLRDWGIDIPFSTILSSLRDWIYLAASLLES